MKHVAWLACAILVLAASARADDDEAIAAMRRGVAAFGRGEAEEALREYEVAKKAAPNANMPYRYAAEALAALGRWKEAVENLEGYLAKNPSVSDAADVREHIAKIRAEHYPARVRVIVLDANGAEVWIDGMSRGAPALFEVEPGHHHIEVHAPGRDAAAQDASFVGDQEASLGFTLAPSRVETPPPPPPKPAAPPVATPWRTVGWITAGVGGATLLTTLVVDLAALGPKIEDYRSAADRGDSSARGLRDDAQTLRTITIVGYGAGAALAVGGAALILLAPRTQSTGASFTPWLASGTGGITARAAF